MVYLPINQSILIAGGRNDVMCKNMNNPFLDDMYLFLMDQKAWQQVKYVPHSQTLCRIGNHSMCVMTDNETYEKVLIFGGLNNLKDKNSPGLGN